DPQATKTLWVNRFSRLPSKRSDSDITEELQTLFQTLHQMIDKDQSTSFLAWPKQRYTRKPNVHTEAANQKAAVQPDTLTTYPVTTGTRTPEKLATQFWKPTTVPA